MNNQTLSDLLGNTVVIFLLQVAIFSLPPFYIATLRRPLRSAAFYVYVSIVLVIGGFLGAVYSIPLTESIVISGGNLAYGALMYATILLVITEADIFATRNVIRLVITVNVLKYILFSVFSWSLSLNTILNPFDTAPDLFAVSAKLMIIGGVLIIVELLILLFFFEQIKTRVSNFYAQFILFVVSFMAVLLLDGVLFPLIAFGINASLESIVVGGIVGKFVMAAAYSVALLGFLFIFRNRLTTYLAIPIGLRDQLTANREKLIEEIGRQQKSIAKKDQALHESEERLRLALKASGQGLYDLNLQTGAAEANDQYALMLGYDPETFEETNAKWIERLHPDDYEQVTQYFNDYVAGKIPEYRVDFRQKTQDGRWIWIASLGEIVEFDSAGNPLRMVGTHLNITERKTAEAQQQRSEARYRALFEYSPVSLWEEDFSEVKQAIDQLVISDGVTDLETYLQQHEDVLQALVTKVNVLDINQRTLALYRYESKESFLGNLEISSPALLHNFISQMAAVAEGITNLQFNTQTYTVDGERLDIVLEWTVQPGYEADYGRVLISIIDITAVVQAEQALAENRRRLQALFDHSQDAIFLADDQGRYKDVNPAACNLTGYSREELLQRTVWDISPGGQEAESQALWQQFIAAGKMDGEYLIKDINGHLIETEFRAVSNITSGLHLSILRDITERKQVQEALVKHVADLAQSNAELEQFAYVASHDLQEPLRMVSSYVQLLARRYQGQLDADADKFIAFAVDGAKRMQILINDLLIYSRVGTQDKAFAAMSCEAVLNNVLTDLQFAIAESEAAVTHDPLPTVMADAGQLAQLWQNLLGNAIKFRGAAAPEIHIGAERQDGMWQFSVRDNGIGMEPQYDDRIFAIFQRLHSMEEYTGTGIGLAVCKKIVERHNGRIWVESEPGKGSTFYFTLPAGPEL